MSEPARERDVAQWIESARAGSPGGLEQIAATYRNYLLLIANQELDAQLQGKVGASDIVQETLLQVQRKFGQFEGGNEEELLAWLRQILRRQLLDAGRRYRDAGKRHAGRERRIAPRDDSQGADLQLAAADKSPRAETIAQEEKEALTRALEKLPEDYRQVILWRSWERLPFAEIGRKLGRSAAAAGKLWARAIERLQRELNS
ncbi:MAG: sigma-70 family RNA polymerase sigma factor [Gemmataceae bacterium]|nr:sigma-70 family RNA polymerase sigma factor [Gemmataceae bacterium]